MVGIYKVMYTVHCENPLRIEAIKCINNESLDWLWCIFTSNLHKLYNFYIITFKDILSAFWVFRLMLHSKSPIIRRKAKRKVQYCQTIKWAKRVWNSIKIWKMSSFKMNPHSKPIVFASYSHLASETRTNLSTLYWSMDKNPLESYWGDYLVTFKGVS